MDEISLNGVSSVKNVKIGGKNRNSLAEYREHPHWDMNATVSQLFKLLISIVCAPTDGRCTYV